VIADRAVVIGSGPSGATAAQVLLEQGIPVTLLESGNAFPGGLIVRAFGRNVFRKWASPQDEYAYSSAGEPSTEWHSALSPGGLSNYWTGAVPRFAPEDFFEGERLHECYRWPLSYADIERYYAYAERLLEVVGERRRVPQLPAAEVLISERRLPRAWRHVAVQAETLGHGLVYAPIADGPSWMIRRSGAAFNSYARIVSRLERFPNFELRLGAHAHRLTWNGPTGRVDGVEYIDRSTGTHQRIGAEAVVVAAGPLASAKLLLQSTSHDFPDGLGNSYDLLGRFVHDHPKDWCLLHLDRPLPRIDQPLHFTRAPYVNSPPLMGAALTIGPLAKWDRLLSFTGATSRRFGAVTFSTMLPEERTAVRLHATQLDEFGMPALEIDLRFGPEVLQTARAAQSELLAVLEQAGIHATLECPVDRLVPGTAAHYGGGVRMHASPRYGMLDGWNRLHAVKNVAVVDASSFTTGVEKNPTLTAMALAARAAERLANDLKSATLTPHGLQEYALSKSR
jgi:choline dehydrogenase-like flavoprotein